MTVADLGLGDDQAERLIDSQAFIHGRSYFDLLAHLMRERPERLARYLRRIFERGLELGRTSQ
jgi:hypothetical protein